MSQIVLQQDGLAVGSPNVRTNKVAQSVLTSHTPVTDDNTQALLKAIILQWLIDAKKDGHALKELADWLDMGTLFAPPSCLV